MSGAGIKLKATSDTPQLTAALTRLQKTGGDSALQAALKSLGEVLLNGTRRRFDAQVDPSGKAWAPLNPAYLGTAADRNKKGRVTTKGVKKGTKILQASGQLFASLRYQIGPGQLQVGTNKVYGAAQQFGATILPKNGPTLIFWMGGRLIHAKKVVLPARPFLGISQTDRTKGLEAVEEVYDSAWSKSP